ncbi:hypothetical protein [Thioalkalivibrio paradoxus]|uniref:Uncharacterized protein n=1 Tax=Thioalkalivibrio paradoxus ARh 1 TaxID=713585 RepID=W0DEZ0_9GAMM|nr:hypothetical protein [Thioalkalivibrio paradoxus]AHE97179.1 hypothetical protein THITH_01570 [Thioalkalivibrio paradoxus ARh 1]
MSALLKLLQADTAVAEARVLDGRLVVRMTHRAPSEDWTRVDRLIGEFASKRKPRRRRRAA